MDRQKTNIDVRGDSPPIEAWLFAQVILGKSIPPIVNPEAQARAKRADLERVAQLSTRHENELRKLDAAEAKALHDREILTWAAEISTDAEKKLRVLQNKEAEEREAWRRAAAYAVTLRECTSEQHLSQRAEPSYPSSIVEWDPNQPRDQLGRWTSTGGGGGARIGGLLGSFIQRNHTIGELSGVVTPGMVHSSRIALNLQAAGQLASDVSAAAAAGLKTGGKAVVNGSATAIKNVATLGLSSSQLELIGVTDQDREQGYDTAVTIATASGQVLVAVGTSGLGTVLSKGGTVARTASGALVAYDTAGNAVGTVQGAYDASQNGINLENGLQITGGALGLAANAKGARGLSQAASAVELEKVKAYIAKCPRTPTRTKTPANHYEIAHTGPHNYDISGGGETFEIDGYRGTTILEAKHAGDLESNPYIPGSTCDEAVRKVILDGARDELQRARTIIESGETPFKSIEIITNTPQSKALFEGILKEVGVPGTVRLAI
jgi:hypothetical protein